MEKKYGFSIFHLFAFSLFQITPSFSQKIDLDKFNVPYDRITLPQNFTPTEKRTYKYTLKATPMVTRVLPLDEIGAKIKVYNFKPVDTNPTLEIEANFGDLTIVKTDVEDRTFRSTDPKAIASKGSYYTKLFYKTNGIIVVKAEGKTIAKYGLNIRLVF